MQPSRPVLLGRLDGLLNTLRWAWLTVVQSMLFCTHIKSDAYIIYISLHIYTNDHRTYNLLHMKFDSLQQKTYHDTYCSFRLGPTLEVRFDTNSGMIRLMVQKSETTTWDVFETL